MKAVETSKVNFGAKKPMRMNKKAKEFYNKILSLTRKEVLSDEQLLGMPRKDLFQKAEAGKSRAEIEMSRESFWTDPNNIAKYTQQNYAASRKFDANYMEQSERGEVFLPDGKKLVFFERGKGKDLNETLNPNAYYFAYKDEQTGIVTYLETNSWDIALIKKGDEVLTPQGLNKEAQNLVDRNRARANGNYAGK